MPPYTVIFIGPQGSGKGTQLDSLKRLLETKSERKTVALQSGSLFRAFAQGETYTGARIAETINTGKLQPLFLSIGLWAKEMIDTVDEHSNMLIDGFPRTIDEAHVLTTALSFYKRDEAHVIVLEAPEETVRARMKARARADDTNEAIERRLAWYREETKAILGYFTEAPRYTLHHVDALQDIETVRIQIAQALNLHDS